jgi:hypothetical protein
MNTTTTLLADEVRDVLGRLDRAEQADAESFECPCALHRRVGGHSVQRIFEELAQLWTAGLVVHRDGQWQAK